MFQTRDFRRKTFQILVPLIASLFVPILFLALPPTVHAQGNCPASGRDYGDAPSSYGIACATPAASLRIGGTTPTARTYAVCGTGLANCDAADNFLNPLTPIDLAYSQYIWTVPISNTTGSTAYLSGWIDLNGNGAFDSTELATANVPNGSTEVTLTWNIPNTATPNLTTFARLRISPTSGMAATGDYSNGEVEDYQVTTVQSIVCAPGTTFYFIDRNTDNGIVKSYDISSGTSTTIVNPGTVAKINGIAVDQSRGFIYYQDAGATSSDGIFYYDVVNATSGTVTGDAGANPLNIPLNSGWASAAGAFANNKYYVGIDGDNSGRIYEITLNSAGAGPVSARGLITPTIAGYNNVVDYGDIIVIGNRMYVAFERSGSTYEQYLDVYDINSQLLLSRQTLTSTTAWGFQLARDGNGQIWALQGNNGRVFTVTNGLIEGYPNNYVRAIGVEVSDGSECTLATMDFGDAPTTYGWDAGPGAARHALTTNLRLGNAALTTANIRDLRGFSSSNADGDDLNNTDDEDAAPLLPVLATSSISYTIPNIVVYNNTGTSATLYAWIDFNRDGQFQQSERATVAVPSGTVTRTVSVTWTGLSGLVAGQSYARLRLSTATTTNSNWGTGNDGAFLATGYASDGELEDYSVQIYNPTAVTLSSFKARANSFDLGDAVLQSGWLWGGATASITGWTLARRYRQARKRN